MKTFLSKNMIWLVIIAAIIAIAAIYISLTESDGSTAVATVGNEKITKTELYDNLVKRYGEQALENMIIDKIIEIEAKKANITITDEEVQKEMDTIIAAYGSQEAFELQMEQSGITQADVKSDIVTYLNTIKLLEPRITVTEEDILEYFEENKDSYAKPEQVEASHILVSDEATAIEIKKKLDDGKDFAELAAEYSLDSGNAQNGGKLGYFGRGKMVEAFEDAAFSMDVNEISDPVKTEFGYHIIMVTGRQEAQEATLEDNKAEIEETLRNEKISEEYSIWLSEKREEYDIYNSLAK